MTRATIIALALSGVPAAAMAHPLVDRAAEQVEQAQFEAALRTLAEAAEAADLHREDVTELLRTRAIAHFAIGDENAMREDLLALAVVAPELELDVTVPPGVQEAFAEQRQRAGPTPKLEASAEADAQGFVVAVTLDREVPLTHSLLVHWRFEDGAWTASEGPTVRIPAPRGATIDYWAEARGPGGAALWTAGSEASPRSASTAKLVSPTGNGSGRAEVDDGADARAWPWIIAGAAVLVAGGVVATLLLLPSDTDDRTHFEPVQVEWP